MSDLISREALKQEVVKLCRQINANNGITVPTLAFTRIIDNAPTVEGRMVYVQETVNTILNSRTGNTDIDKAFRNAARFVQNAIDGKSVDFEELERAESEDFEPSKGEWIVHHIPYTHMSYTHFSCSECNYGNDIKLGRTTNFCPNCGAMMSEREK